MRASDSHRSMLGRSRLRRDIISTELNLYEGRVEFIKRERVQACQWGKEGLAGRWLLSPQAVEGLEVVEGPKFEKYVVKEDTDSEDSDIISAGTVD